ncbi:MAG: ATP-binding protein [Solirubrobacteraceae bacterium]
MRIRGGVRAPSRARRSVLSQLEGQIAPTTASDVALIVSELVTNSVLHADVGPAQTLTLELTRLDDRVRIDVIDPGSRLEPRILPPDPERLGGLGLFVVDQLSEAWGIARDGITGTRVWCEVLLDRSRSSQLRTADSSAASVCPG